MRHYLYIVFLALALAGIGQNVSAQDKNSATVTVSGTVTDGSEPLVGVVISILDKPSSGTLTDVDGKFTIKASQGDKLNFSYVGYNKQQYVVMGNKSGLKIVLKSENKVDEVVVTALGTQRKISTLSACGRYHLHNEERRAGQEYFRLLDSWHRYLRCQLLGPRAHRRS